MVAGCLEIQDNYSILRKGTTEYNYIFNQIIRSGTPTSRCFVTVQEHKTGHMGKTKMERERLLA